MPDNNQRDRAALRGLAVGIAVIVVAGLIAACFQSIFSIASVRERAQLEAKRYCEARRDCSSNSLYADIRSANADEAAVNVASWQLVLSIASLLVLGYTVYYAHKAWEEAQRSTETAQAGLKQASAVAVHQLRAYVFVESGNLFAEVRDLAGDGSRMAWLAGASLQLSNKGQTPAYRVRHWSDVVVLPIFDESDLSAPPLTLDFAANIAPGAPAPKTTYMDQPLNPAEMQCLQAGTHAIYVYGRIEYEDAFRKHRWSSYRLSYTGAFPPPTKHSLMFCAQGNDSDQGEDET